MRPIGSIVAQKIELMTLLRRTSVVKLVAWPRGLWLIALAAFLVRSLYLLELRGSPFLSVLIGDAQQYDSWAQEIASGHWIGSEVFYQTPLYPYLLAVFFKVAGHQLFAFRLLQAVFGAASCVFLGVAARRFFDNRTALISAGLLAIYPPAIFFDGLIQKSSLDLLLVTLFIAVLAEFQQRFRWRWLIIAGVVLAVLTINRENARVWYLAVAVWLLASFRTYALRKRIGWAGVFTAAFCLALLPVGLRNYYAGGVFLISTSQLGSNLYIGNHPGAQGSYEPLLPGRGSAAFEREDATALAERASGRKLSPAEVSSYWTHRSLDYIKNQPASWLRLMLKKFVLTLNGTEAADTEGIQAYAQYSRVLTALSWLGFGVMLPLSVLGVYFTRRRWRELWILYALGLSMALAVALFYVVARYRYPLVPFVILFAACALSTTVNWRQLKWKEVLPGATLALMIGITCNFLFRNSNDVTFLNFGQELVRLGKANEAVPLLQTAIKDSPDDAQAHFNLAVALNEVGRKEEALDEFSTAIKLAPQYFEALAAMGLTLLETGRPAGAAQHFREAVRLRPDLVGIRLNLANALMQSDARAEAIKEYEEALRLDPNNAATHNSLGVALQQDNQAVEAIKHYEIALRLQPNDAGIHSNFALALEAIGKKELAIQQLQTALQLQPQSVGIRMNLADILMRAGRTNEAITHYQEAATQSGSFEIYYELAQACLRVGRDSDALASLEKSLILAQNSGHVAEAAQIADQLNSIRAKRPALGKTQSSN